MFDFQKIVTKMYKNVQSTLPKIPDTRMESFSHYMKVSESQKYIKLNTVQHIQKNQQLSRRRRARLCISHNTRASKTFIRKVRASTILQLHII